MTSAITQRVHRLADSLAELKMKVRAALATELAGAVGTAIRDVLVVALIDRLVVAPTRSSYSSPRTGTWRDDEYDRDRDRWGDPRDPWADDSDARDRVPSRDAHHDREETETMPAVPAAAAVIVGANIGRWWLARKGSIAAAVGLGVLATGLGLAGGPVARAALAVLAATTDLLTAESALARLDPS
jgi:hypothetical protein